MIGWIGSLTHLTKGNGFMLKSSTQTTFTYPSVPLTARLAPEPVSESDMHSVGMSFDQYPSNMSILATANMNFDEGNQMMVYDETDLVGYAYPKYIGQQQLLFITVFGEQPSGALSFEDSFGRLYAPEDGRTLEFRADASHGTVGSPLRLMTNTTEVLEVINSTVRLYPNPFQESILLEITSDMKDLSFELVDLSGRLLQKGNIPTHQKSIRFGETLESGAYFLKIYRAEELVKTEKIVKY